jgi:hypothetical protein
MAPSNIAFMIASGERAASCSRLGIRESALPVL